jgi:hypothetical protein
VELAYRHNIFICSNKYIMKSDLIFSLGPNCRNTWNLRSYFGINATYPFDWWITPAKSMLRMLEPGFKFHVDQDDLLISPPYEHNTVYNYKLNILHHHDFPRRWDGNHQGVVLSTEDKDIENINQKYTYLFKRFFEAVKNVSNPVAVLNGSLKGFGANYKGIVTNRELNGFVPHHDLANEVRERLGKKLKVVFVEIGDKLIEQHEWGCIVRLPDLGIRPEENGSGFEEPVHVFTSAFEEIGLNLTEQRIRTGVAGLREIKYICLGFD